MPIIYLYDLIIVFNRVSPFRINHLKYSSHSCLLFKSQLRMVRILEAFFQAILTTLIQAHYTLIQSNLFWIESYRKSPVD